MDSELLKAILLKTAKRCVLRKYKYHKLSEERLSEADIRNVMAKVLEEEKHYYGLEIPTRETYMHLEDNRFTRKALVDLVIYEHKDDQWPSVFVEFKRSQPDSKKIEKDFYKMLGEPESLKGGCFFHVLQKADYGSNARLNRARKNIISKYEKAYDKTRSHPRFNRDVLQKRWFILFVLDASEKQYVFCSAESMDNPLIIDNNWQYIWGVRG